jgi:Na+/melibiose symporter-like transporter
LPDVVPHAQRGEASGYYGVANLLGIASGTVGAGLLLAHYGRGAAILSVAVVLVTTMLVTVLLVPDRAPRVDRQFQGIGEILRKTFGVPFRNRPFVWLMVSRLLIFMGFGGLQNYSYFYFDNVFFHHNMRATAIAASTLLGIAIGVAALVTWPASRLSDRTGRRPLIFGAGLCGAVGSLVLVFSHYQWVPGPVVVPLASFLKVPDLAAQATLTGLVIGVGPRGRSLHGLLQHRHRRRGHHRRRGWRSAARLLQPPRPDSWPAGRIPRRLRPVRGVVHRRVA